MENEYIEKTENEFAFIEDTETQNYFADLNIELLKGNHIQSDSYYLFKLLSKHENDIRNYYDKLYSLNLVKDKYDNESFYYLDFFIEGKGKLSHPTRHKELSEAETIMGIMLLNMYYERYFEHPKEIKWLDIRKEILESENSSSYKLILFNDIRDDYSDPEWDTAKKTLKRTLRDFSVLGWTSRLTEEDGEEINFLLKVSIHRFAKLYDEEISNFDKFVHSYM